MNITGGELVLNEHRSFDSRVQDIPYYFAAGSHEFSTQLLSRCSNIGVVNNRCSVQLFTMSAPYVLGSICPKLDPVKCVLLDPPASAILTATDGRPVLAVRGHRGCTVCFELEFTVNRTLKLHVDGSTISTAMSGLVVHLNLTSASVSICCLAKAIHYFTKVSKIAKYAVGIMDDFGNKCLRLYELKPNKSTSDLKLAATRAFQFCMHAIETNCIVEFSYVRPNTTLLIPVPSSAYTDTTTFSAITSRFT